MDNSQSGYGHQKRALWFSTMLALVMVFIVVQVLQAAEGGPISEVRPVKEQGALTANLDGSTKTVNQATATAGSVLLYTIVISNSGDTTATNVTMTDILPTELAYTGTLSHNTVNGIGVADDTNGIVTWAGTLQTNGYATLTFQAVLTDTATPGTIITNTAEITGTGALILRSATTQVISPTATTTTTLYLPLVVKPIGVPALSATTPTPANEWAVSWTAVADATGYELQESNDPDFSDVTTFDLAGNITSQAISHPPSVDNVYYYRVRAKVGTQVGPWSNVVTVVGASVELTLQATRPNSANQWTLSWNGSGAANYELQEAQNANFNNAAIYNLTGVTSQTFNHSPSPYNSYYYRVRAVVGNITGPWSNVQQVIGGYHDDFNDPASGWAIRRTTLLEEVRSWYENGTFILQVEDSWDWGIASPRAQAPSVPYVIEFRSQPAHTANLVSHGAVFGGDWPGAVCPDYTSLPGVYEHNLCFNHFYNTNIIFYGPLKLLFERVDYLEWRPQDGGSPMKRGSFDNYASWFEVGNIPNVDGTGWNTWRIEVRSSGIQLYANGHLFAQTGDTMWIHEPYFGVFASTDEYSNSTWRFDYYRVMPLDN